MGVEAVLSAFRVAFTSLHGHSGERCLGSRFAAGRAAVDGAPFHASPGKVGDADTDAQRHPRTGTGANERATDASISKPVMFKRAGFRGRDLWTLGCNEFVHKSCPLIERNSQTAKPSAIQSESGKRSRAALSGDPVGHQHVTFSSKVLSTADAGPRVKK